MWCTIKARTGGGEVCGVRLRLGLGVGKCVGILSQDRFMPHHPLQDSKHQINKE